MPLLSASDFSHASFLWHPQAPKSNVVIYHQELSVRSYNRSWFRALFQAEVFWVLASQAEALYSVVFEIGIDFSKRVLVLCFFFLGSSNSGKALSGQCRGGLATRLGLSRQTLMQTTAEKSPIFSSWTCCCALSTNEWGANTLSRTSQTK